MLRALRAMGGPFLQSNACLRASRLTWTKFDGLRRIDGDFVPCLAVLAEVGPIGRLPGELKMGRFDDSTSLLVRLHHRLQGTAGQQRSLGRIRFGTVNEELLDGVRQRLEKTPIAPGAVKVGRPMRPSFPLQPSGEVPAIGTGGLFENGCL